MQWDLILALQNSDITSHELYFGKINSIVFDSHEILQKGKADYIRF